MQPNPVRRSTCACCMRPTKACICAFATPVTSALQLLILQHPLEVANAKGTARLLQLSVAGSVLAVGEQFEAAQLETLLYAGGRIPLLLYPDAAGERALGLPAPPPLAATVLAQAHTLRLVLLDGTWRKSRKMLYLNPLLHALPRVVLRATPPSHYLIRKAHAPDQLSTLEAACYALGQLEGDDARFAALLDGMDRMVARYDATRLHQGVVCGAG